MAFIEVGQDKLLKLFGRYQVIDDIGPLVMLVNRILFLTLTCSITYNACDDFEIAMPDNGPVLRLDKVCKNFGGLRVLVDLDMSVARQEMVGLIGPNGAGKSTVFNVITGLYRPEPGQCLFSR